MTRVDLNEVIDPFGARVVVETDATGQASEAWFDLVGLPRVDAMLIGRSASEAPRLIERLCGLCPVAHHLAGTAALDDLGGFAVPPTALAVRRLLHLGSVVDNHAIRFAAGNREDAMTLRRFGRAAMALAGSPSHFPSTAVPGGVRAGWAAAAASALMEGLPEALDAAERIASALVRTDGVPDDRYRGADLALVDDEGRPDLLGSRVRAVAHDGTIRVGAASAEDWPSLVSETHPGASVPRPYLTDLGPDKGGYRVGPVAQLRIGVPVTPRAASWRARWLDHDGSAEGARPIVVIGAIESIGVLVGAGLPMGPLVGERSVADERSVASAPESGMTAHTGTGWVDGPRGLLVHTYETDADGVLTSTRILTPTAQNEPWLSSLLTDAARGPQAERAAAMEASVREADPCLPVSSAPPGAMGLTVVSPSTAPRKS